MAKLRRPKATTTETLRDALRARFAAPAWAYLEEVGNATGWGCVRHADAVAMSLWPSRGLELHGIEIKVSRQDWQKELKSPAKADAIVRYMDRWWLAVSDAAIVKPGELPPTWGLLEFTGGKLACRVEAPKLTPEPLDRAFVAALLRKAHEGQLRLVQQARAEGFQEGKTLGPEAHQRELARVKSELAHLQERVSVFAEASGIALSEWRYQNAGAVVLRLLQGHTNRDAIETAQRVLTELDHAKSQLSKKIDDLKAEDKVVADWRARNGLGGGSGA